MSLGVIVYKLLDKKYTGQKLILKTKNEQKNYTI